MKLRINPFHDQKGSPRHIGRTEAHMQTARRRMTHLFSVLLLLVTTGSGGALVAAELHVSPRGNDANDGSSRNPYRSISAAAQVAQPGDVITVHEGIYRERVNPPRGGTSEDRRIVYRAAVGEQAEIRGSERIQGWVKVQGDVWKVTLPNSFFGSFNPYSDLINGDWFNPRGREHHTGAVYLNGEWLIEATKLEEVMVTDGTLPAWLNSAAGQYLLNVAWFRPVQAAANTARVPAAGFATQQGVQTAPCSEGGECIGWIEHGDWARYERVDFGTGAEEVEIRAASVTQGGVIEVRLDGPTGELLGSCSVKNTGDWQSWASFTAKIPRTRGVKTVCFVFRDRAATALRASLWFARVDDANTTIWAQFEGVDPNQEEVEINVRQSVFYPEEPGRNYITVRGFTLRHAATPWAPPTAEQVGLIGTHWSKGWIIEDNTISHSVCTGITLGKHGDAFDNTSADTAEGYVKTIERGLARGWNKATIGHHIVRNNTISHCEQAGIVGSLGPTFCLVSNNVIHDIHVRRLFTGAEMAGIKFHAAIDTVIRDNHVYRTCRGLWLDWMAQGTRVTGNLFHDNFGEDLFVEVNHGPFLVDNNLFLSGTSLLDMSQGGAYAHNLFHGRIISRPELSRETPYHPAHTTAVAGLSNIKGSDNRFYNNLFIGRGAPGETAASEASKDPEWRGDHGLWVYDFREFPVYAGGNVFYNGARPYKRENGSVVIADHDPGIELLEGAAGWTLRLEPGENMTRAKTTPVTTALLGKAKIPNLPYENPDGSPLTVDIDYYGKPRPLANPVPGPFGTLEAGGVTLKVW